MHARPFIQCTVLWMPACCMVAFWVGIRWCAREWSEHAACVNGLHVRLLRRTLACMSGASMSDGSHHAGGRLDGQSKVVHVWCSPTACGPWAWALSCCIQSNVTGGYCTPFVTRAQQNDGDGWQGRRQARPTTKLRAAHLKEGRCVHALTAYTVVGYRRLQLPCRLGNPAFLAPFRQLFLSWQVGQHKA